MVQESFVGVFDSIQDTPEKEANQAAPEQQPPLLGSGESFANKGEAPNRPKDPVIESQQFNVH